MARVTSISLFGLMFLIFLVPLASAWWDDDWNSYKLINLTTTYGATEDNFTVDLNISWATEMQPDFDGLRFVNGSENTKLDYWIKEKVDGEWAYVWVKVDQNITSDKNQTIYMYYGNAAASSTSDGESTFLVFDNGTTNQTGWRLGRDGATYDYQINATENALNMRKQSETAAGTDNYYKAFLGDQWTTFSNFTAEVVLRPETLGGTTYGLVLNTTQGTSYRYIVVTLQATAFFVAEYEFPAGNLRYIYKDLSVGFGDGGWFTINWTWLGDEMMDVQLYRSYGSNATLMSENSTILDSMTVETPATPEIGLMTREIVSNVTYDNFTVRKALEWDIVSWVGLGVRWSNNWTFKNVTYSPTIIENTEQEFTLTLWRNLTTVENITADLIWNWSGYAYQTFSENGNYITFHRNVTSLDIHNISVSTEFYWNFTMNYKPGYGSTHEYGNTSIYTQNITSTYISNCTSDETNMTVMWLFLKDEELRTAVNGTLEATFELWTRVEEERSTYAFNYTQNYTEYSFCLFPEYGAVYANIEIEYAAMNYSKRNYYFLNVELSNISINRTLYLLNDDLSIEIDIEVKNPYSALLEGVVVQAQRYFLGEDEYRLVAMAKTGYDGKGITYLKGNVWYKYIILDENGAILNTITPTHLSVTTLTLYTAYEEVIALFEYFENVAYNCTFNNATKNIVCTIVDSSGHLQESFLVAKTVDPFGSITICSDSSTSPSTTLVCNINGYTNRTVIYYLYGEFSSFDTLYLMIQDSLDFSVTTTYGSMGVFVTILLLLVAVLAGVWNPVVALVLFSVALIAAVMVNFLVVGFMPLVGIIFVAGIIAYRMRS